MDLDELLSERFDVRSASATGGELRERKRPVIPPLYTKLAKYFLLSSLFHWIFNL